MSSRTSLIQTVLVILFVVSSACIVQGMGSNEKRSNQSQAKNSQEKKQHQLINKRTKQKNYAPEQIIVKFKDDTGDQVIKSIQIELHLEIIKRVYKPNVYLMKILDDSTVESVIERLQKYKEVKYSEPNFIRKIY
ncbi:hypothetical protein ACFL0M_07970 [Thermodesulfobacteriota bacterium]